LELARSSSEASVDSITSTTTSISTASNHPPVAPSTKGFHYTFRRRDSTGPMGINAPVISNTSNGPKTVGLISSFVRKNSFSYGSFASSSVTNSKNPSLHATSGIGNPVYRGSVSSATDASIPSRTVSISREVTMSVNGSRLVGPIQGTVVRETLLIRKHLLDKGEVKARNRKWIKFWCILVVDVERGVELISHKVDQGDFTDLELSNDPPMTIPVKPDLQSQNSFESNNNTNNTSPSKSNENPLKVKAGWSNDTITRSVRIKVSKKNNSNNFLIHV